MTSHALPDRPLRFGGALRDLGPAERRALRERTTSADDGVRERTAAIVRRVRDEGDRALRALALELDRVALDALEVERGLWDEALEALPAELRAALERAQRNIARAHEAFRPQAGEVETEPGVVVGRRPDPLGRVGVYAPGGRAAYPSSLLMGAVPARVAGVGEVIVCSPPGPTGTPAAVVLAAAALAGVDRVFALGGAGAIAAMAYGTASVPRVDRIVGPGNAYVAEAKLQVAGVVAIDSPAGPSELLVVCDDSADPALVAREMLAQAEHDPLAAIVAVTASASAARAVVAALEAQLPAQPRAEICRAALEAQGAVLWVDSLAEGIAFANRYAAEHVQLSVNEPAQGPLLERLRNAGTVFVGESSSVAFGDYM